MEKIEPRSINSTFSEPASSFMNVNGIRIHTLD